MSIEIKPVVISGEIIIVAIFSTWIFLTILCVHQAEINTEYRMRVERVEDMILGINVPVTQKIKESTDVK